MNVQQMEQMMQAEVEALKKREEEMISCLQKDRDQLLTEKQRIEQV